MPVPPPEIVQGIKAVQIRARQPFALQSPNYQHLSFSMNLYQLFLILICFQPTTKGWLFSHEGNGMVPPTISPSQLFRSTTMSTSTLEPIKGKKPLTLPSQLELNSLFGKLPRQDLDLAALKSALLNMGYRFAEDPGLLNTFWRRFREYRVSQSDFANEDATPVSGS